MKPEKRPHYGVRLSRGLGARGLGAAVCLLVLQACTYSGGPLFSNNAGGELEPYAYPPGVQSVSSVTVAPGDTLYSIAQNNQIDLAALIELNDLSEPYDLTPGDVLEVPGPASHIVATGETLTSISKGYKVDVATLATINGLYEPYEISVGQELALPAGVSRKRIKTAAVARPAGAGWRLSGGAPKEPRPPETSKGKKTKTIARATPRGGGKFLWPVHGTIISTFGSKGSGKHNDGINIAVESGTHILAASGGTVTYVGNEVRGYGNLVLIRHRGDWVTAYAHMRKVWVEEGEAVTRGQHIANAGKSGDATQPQVHFELRRGQKTYDPEQYLNLE